MSEADRRRALWFFEGMSWVCVASSIAVPVVCLLLVPRERIADRNLSIALAHSVYRLVHVEAIIASLALLSLFGLKKWKPVGIIVRSVIAIAVACFGSYVFVHWAFALSFWR
jgi:hypothetical protein